MLNSFRSKRTSVLTWVMMTLLIVGLAGFGIGVSGGLGSGEVARVGDRSISADDYVNALQQELRAITGQLGRSVPMEEARQFGIDRSVLARLANDAALDGEAARLGISTGDETVGEQVMTTPAFQGSDGGFDRAAYVFALERIGLTPAEFEELVRHEATRELLASGVQSAADMPDGAALAVLGYVGERRGFEWLRLDAGLLPEPVAAPIEDQLVAEHAAHPERYTRPETRRITYASVTPEALAATIEIPEDELRAAYDAEPARFSTPERRLLDRIGFRTAEEAASGRARLDAGDIDFEALAAERGLAPAEIDQGEVTADALAPEAREAVFGAAGPGVVGPVATPLGPSIFRINGILAGRTEPFEEAREALARELALEAARAQIADETVAIDDLIAGGARLEEVAAETAMELGSIELTEASTGGLADDPAFRAAAAEARQGEETDIVELEDGGLVTLRLEEVVPPALIPLDEIRERVAAEWTAARTREALELQARGHADELAGGLGFAELAERLGVVAHAAEPLTRGQTAPDVPRELVAAVFAAAPGGTVIHPEASAVILARITAVEEFEPGAEGNVALYDNLRSQFRAQVADDMLVLYTAALRDAAGVSVNQDLIESTLARFP